LSVVGGGFSFSRAVLSFWRNNRLLPLAPLFLFLPVFLVSSGASSLLGWWRGVVFMSGLDDVRGRAVFLVLRLVKAGLLHLRRRLG
jgi:hypothetical protein